jgi:hypothetical protein
MLAYVFEWLGLLNPAAGHALESDKCEERRKSNISNNDAESNSAD